MIFLKFLPQKGMKKFINKLVKMNGSRTAHCDLTRNKNKRNFKRKRIWTWKYYLPVGMCFGQMEFEHNS